MKYFNLFLLVLFLSSSIRSYSQAFIHEIQREIDQTISAEQKEYTELISAYAEKIDQIVASEKEIEELNATIDKIKRENTIAPKGEFETTEQFLSRKKEGQDKLDALISPLNQSILKLNRNQGMLCRENYRLFYAEYKEILEQINELEGDLKNNPLKTISLQEVSSLNYDADKQTFKLSSPMLSSDYIVYVELSKAKDFKQNINKVKFIMGYNTLLGFVYNNELSKKIYPLSISPDLKKREETLLLLNLHQLFHIPFKEINKKPKISPHRLLQDSKEAEFPGGLRALSLYIGNNVRYPPEAQDKKEQGRVVVTFTVTKDGSIRDVKVLRGVSPSLNAEAVRVVKSMPRWSPATQCGVPFESNVSIPLNFSIVDNDSEKKKRK